MVSISYGFWRHFSESGFKYGIDQMMEVAKASLKGLGIFETVFVGQHKVKAISLFGLKPGRCSNHIK